MAHAVTDHQAPGEALGIYAKFSSTLDSKEKNSVWAVDHETGETANFELLPGGKYREAYEPAKVRSERFSLQSVVRELLPKSRTAKCYRWRLPKKATEVMRSTETGGTFYRGLQVCSSVWVCPVCAAKISERRRAELLAAIEAHKAAGGVVVLVTLTNPHYMGQGLEGLLKRQQRAFDFFKSGRPARNLRDSFGLVGYVRSLEVTYGANGWHPHYHELWFLRSQVDLLSLQKAVFSLWESACVKAGLGRPSVKHGVTVQDGSKAAAYASKWGLESEMTKWHVKKGNQSLTPFDLLRSYFRDSNENHAALFREYAQAFHGKKQLVWSNGLKALFNLVDLDDGEIAARADQSAVVLGQITADQWRLVLAVDGRSTVLDLARHGWDVVRAYLLGLSQRIDLAKLTPNGVFTESLNGTG